MLQNLILIATFSTVAFARDDGIARLPVMGWNTWCTGGSCHQAGANGSYHDVCHDAEIRDIALTMISTGMFDMGFTSISLDDCFAALERKDGHLVADPARFPEGLKPLADWLHDLGFTFGLYTSLGNWTCSTGSRPSPNPGAPGSYGYYEQDCMDFAAWGMDSVKWDWCGISGDWPTKETLTAQAVDAMNKTGRPMWSNFHSDENGMVTWERKYGDFSRITHDHHDNWASSLSNIMAISTLAKYSGCRNDGTGCYFNDPDFVELGGAGCDNPTPGMRCPGQSNDEYLSYLVNAVIMPQGLYLIASDVRNMTEFMRYAILNPELIAIHQDQLRVAGGLTTTDTSCTTVSPTLGGIPPCQIWSRPLITNATAVSLFNADDSAHTITLKFSDVGLMGTCMIRDVLNQTSFGSATNSISIQVPLHGTRLFTLSNCH